MSNSFSANKKWEMRFDPSIPVKLSPTEFTILRDLIAERTGLCFNDNKRDLLEDKLSPLVLERGFSSFLDYYYLLKYDATAAVAEWSLLTETLRVPETYFWREFDQIQILVQTILPQYVALNPKLPLRIWSAVCSTGEEPLTIAMALNEAGWFERIDIEIVASDISHQAIEKARQGLYRGYSLRNLSLALQAKYFTAEQNFWRITPEIHRRVKWTNANLISKTEVAPLARAHFIYCRNVFIYFSEATVRQTVKQFFDFMPTPGYLFVGASESLLKLTTDFDLQEINGAFVYVKH